MKTKQKLVPNACPAQQDNNNRNKNGFPVGQEILVRDTDSDQDKNDRIDDKNHRFPDGDKGIPAFGGKLQKRGGVPDQDSRHHAGQDTGQMERVRQDEGTERRGERQKVSDQKIFCPSRKKMDDPRDKKSADDTSSCNIKETCGLLEELSCSRAVAHQRENEAEQNHRAHVVEQAFGLHQEFQSSPNLQVPEQRNHRHRIGRGDQYPEGQRGNPSPSKQKMHSKQRDDRRNKHSHRSENNDNKQVPPQLLPADTERPLKNEGRQKDIKNQILRQDNLRGIRKKRQDNPRQEQSNADRDPDPPGQDRGDGRHNEQDFQVGNRKRHQTTIPNGSREAKTRNIPWHSP